MLVSCCLLIDDAILMSQHCLTDTSMFKHVQDNDLSEFDESRDIIESLVDEYKACESPDYIKWGMEVAIIVIVIYSLVFYTPSR